MVSQIKVDNILESTSGAGVEIPGHVVQVVSTDDHTVASYSLSGTSPQKLGSLEISITPKSTSSKIYLSATINGQCKGRYMAVCFVRGTNTKLGESTNTAGSRSLVFMSPVYGEYTDVEYSALPTSMEYVDSPSTTSQLTYKTTFSLGYSANGTVYVQYQNNVSRIQLLEIAA